MKFESYGVHGLLLQLIRALDEKDGIETHKSRNGLTYRFTDPVILHSHSPWERYLMVKDRNANPFFHYIEAMWMLAGRCDVASLTPFNKRMIEFSDDEITFWGAYGFRLWPHWEEAQRQLLEEPDSRRVVLPIYEPHDLPYQGKDVPCNLMLQFKRNDWGALNMYVYNRSNDVIWGAVGANFVHFSIMHEYMAASVGMPIGHMYQISTDMHFYLSGPVSDIVANLRGSLKADTWPLDPYRHVDNIAGSYEPLFEDPEGLRKEAQHFFDHPHERSNTYLNRAMRDACRVRWLYNHKKDMPMSERLDWLKDMEQPDLTRACRLWLEWWDARQ